MSDIADSETPTPNANPPQTTMQGLVTTQKTTPPHAEASTPHEAPALNTTVSEDDGLVTGALPFATRVITTSNASVVYAMCYTQPCPLQGVETAFNSVLADMEVHATQASKFIEVTYQMPPRFNIHQIPTSPAATPTGSSSGGDYFSSVYTRGIVAQDYNTAMAQSGSSSPRPSVAPGSINVAMLERYIPPPTLNEYTNLFSADMPSALVDRLFELSPNNGTLIFIYPTAQGANAFLSTYLRPLLDPLLRTLASAHGLSANLPAAVGAIAALQGDLFTFDKTVNKLNLLLRKLARPTSTTGRTGRVPPTFALVHTEQSLVDIGKSALVNWWLEQEQERIRKAVKKNVHDTKQGSINAFDKFLLQDATQDSIHGLAEQILSGLKKRDYNDYDAPREGIEVGLYVIQRTS